MRLKLFRPLAWSTTLPCDLSEVPKILQVYLWRYAIYYICISYKFYRVLDWCYTIDGSTGA